MYQFLVTVVRPFASALFYRNFIKNDLANKYQRDNPKVTRDLALYLAQQDIDENKVPALEVPTVSGTLQIARGLAICFLCSWACWSF